MIVDRREGKSVTGRDGARLRQGFRGPGRGTGILRAELQRWWLPEPRRADR